MLVCVIFDNLGPYHIARLRALSRHCELMAVEFRAKSKEYAWDTTESTPFRRITLAEPTPGELRRSLDAARPDVVFVPGWSGVAALTALAWASRRAVPAVIMSDSQEIDFRRSVWKELFKKQLLKLAAGYFVAGRPHRDYVVKLGGDANHIVLGYDVIDNRYFSVAADLVREHADEARESLGVPGKYLLTSTRFIPRKNIIGMLEAFAVARVSSQAPWSFVILGDGEQRAEIEATIERLGLDEAVLLPGFKQYPELPRWYGLANAFVLASTSEQWGLVVNEAMASGLPVLVSKRCGCAAELVIEGETGFTFDPDDIKALALLMQNIISMDDGDLRMMGMAARRQVERFSPEVFASNAAALACEVAGRPSQDSFFLAKVLLPLLIWAMARKAEAA